MKLKQYQVDAFSSRVFGGNPAAVVPLTEWLDDDLLQAIAEENNLSETAFFVPADDGFHLRWFTPSHEVKLCGHATLASAYVLFEILAYQAAKIRFHTQSGDLVVERDGDYLAMDFPAQVPAACDAATLETLSRGLRSQPSSVLASQYYLAVFDSEDDIAAIAPDFAVLSGLDKAIVIVTARAAEQPGSVEQSAEQSAEQSGEQSVDFVSRVFAPALGIPEDPVTGAAHCALAPYWADVLGKSQLKARQISRRGGYMECDVRGDRVTLRGQAVLFSQGEILL